VDHDPHGVVLPLIGQNPKGDTFSGKIFLLRANNSPPLLQERG
jgi:hypothetical protein